MTQWRKGCESGHCIEVSLEPVWTKPCDGGACVEVQLDHVVVKIRDSKDPDGPVLNFTIQEWINFKEAVVSGKFD